MKITNSPPQTDYRNTRSRRISPAAPCRTTSADGTSSSPREQLIQKLQGTYTHLDFDFVSLEDSGAVKDYAASHPGMNHVTISPELLDRMLADKSVMNHVTDILDSFSSYQSAANTQSYLLDRTLTDMGLVLHEDGSVSKWTVTKEKDASKRKDENYLPLSLKRLTEKSSRSLYPPKSKNTTMISYKYSHSANMMRLAGARSVSAVRGLIASKHGEIGTVKLKVQDKTEAAIIIRKIKAVIQSGHIKIARLHKEERIYERKKAAEKRRKILLERQLAEELKKKRIARKGQERCQTIVLDDVLERPKNPFDHRPFGGQTGGVSAQLPGGSQMSPSPASPSPPAEHTVTVSPAESSVSVS